MMRNGVKIIGLAAVAALAMTALAVQEAVTLKRVIKVGDSAKYHLKATLEGAQFGDAELNATVTEKVTKLADSGDYELQSTMSDGKVTVGGQEMEIPSQDATVTTYNALGQALSIKDPSGDPNSMRLAHLQSLIFPKTPVKVGDSWTVTIKKDDKGSVDAEGTYKVEGTEKVGDYDTLKISGNYKETGGDTPASSTGTYWINIKDGTLVKLVGSMKQAPYPQVGPMDAKIVLTLDGVK
jgi:hypothetical protein